MTNYIIQTDMTSNLHSQPLFWAKDGVVGILRANEAIVFPSAEDAENALSEIEPRLVRFYGLVIVPAEKSSALPKIGGNGWMVRHPGYDLMH